MRPRAEQFVRPPTLTATVAEHIKEAIFRGILPPGAPLHEVELSKSLGVSRGTVREALRHLQDETLVEIHPHQGAFVTRLSPRKAREIYTLRAQLEPYAVRLAMGRSAYTQGDLDELDALVRRLGDLERSSDPEHRSDLFEIITADMEFHRVMCGRSEHEMLMGVLKSLQSQTRLFILNTILYHSDLELDEPTHRAILTAIQSGDPEHAEAVVRQHIVDAGTSLVTHMEAHAVAGREEVVGSRVQGG
ncbi:MAG: GntR family transcriptional regulator [Bacillati bacterium ANGP1]|uniref:GntR family transcriptional regulator n=1 Tax=Candidatus Segetimicrobium genomatis TaxID=2569760 RepID=A0A537JYV9_9BACT|nr:MAG: GntR family transcriptional regulator [Terrabacteria group bacterium ANGP1]